MGEYWTEENGKYLRPVIFSYITTRWERFGGLIFNPYLGKEEELDAAEAYIVGMCNGNNSCRQIETALHRRFGLSSGESRRYIDNTLEKLERLYAVSFRKAEEASAPLLPDIVYFPEDGPHYCAPKNVIWDVTYRCNLRCKHCLTESGRQSAGELDTAEAVALIDELAEAGILSISLSGGEPFLRPDILTLLRHIAGKKIGIDIATNGVWMPEELIRELRELPVFQIQVSIDGIAEAHDRFRGLEGAFAAACDTIRRLREEGIAVSISTTVTTENLSSLNDIIDLAVDLGCSGYKAIPFLPAGRGRYNSAGLRLDQEGHRRFADILYRRSRELEGKLSLYTEAGYGFLLRGEPQDTAEDGPMGCSAGYDTLSIGADGTAYPCPFLHDFPVGNLKEQSLKQIWHGAPLLKALRGFSKKAMNEACRKCHYSPFYCGGGCRAAAYLEHGDLYAMDPACFREKMTAAEEVR